MSCPICFNKPMNCDCSEEARQLYYLRQEMSENLIEKRLERIENTLIVIAECIKSGEYKSVPMLVQAVLSEEEDDN